MIINQVYENIEHIKKFKEEVNETSVCSMDTELVYSSNQILIAMEIFFKHYNLEEYIEECLSINELESLSWMEIEGRLKESLHRAEKKTEEIYN
jgi:hypothetical protein